MTIQSIHRAVQLQPERFILEEDAEHHLIAFQDADTGYLWLRLPDGNWAWIA